MSARLTTEKTAGARTGETYWSEIWENNDLPEPYDPEDRSLFNLPNRRIDALFRQILKDSDDRLESILEIGCAQSQFLPYFAKHLGLRIAGLDYSEIGCRRTAAVLQKAGVKGDIHHGDMFSPPPHLKGPFDMVFSYGLIEHFEDTAVAIRACASFLRPGGIVVTIIPNFSGLLGYGQKVVDRDIYDIHIPMDCDELRKAHEAAGLSIVKSEYFMFINNNVLTTRKIRNPFLFKTFRRLLSASTNIVWMVEEALKIQLPPNRITSPYTVVVARTDKP